jgi:uncharacterized protein (DUF3820 family)
MAREVDLNEPIGFGKHKDSSWRKAPEGYLHWLARTIPGPKGRNAVLALLERYGALT